MKKKKIKIKSIFKFLLILAAIAVIALIAINIIMCEYVKDLIISPEKAYLTNADCILILGAGVRDDGSPSSMLEDRLITGIDIYDNGICGTMLMSGDHSREEYDEVNCMKNYAVESGVPSERVFMDHAGFSTYESMYRARDVFGAKKVIIVTQQYHLYRALYVAKSLGLDAVGVAADLRTYYGQSLRETRELAARVKDFLYTIIKPAPTYLGTPVSLKESGDQTNG